MSGALRAAGHVGAGPYPVGKEHHALFTDLDRRMLQRAHKSDVQDPGQKSLAEIQALTAAAGMLGGKYLQGCTLYVTVEPCVMCAGAIGWAQISRVVYGAPDDKRGFRTFAPNALHPKCTVTAGVLENECRELIQQFFHNKR